MAPISKPTKKKKSQNANRNATGSLPIWLPRGHFSNFHGSLNCPFWFQATLLFWAHFGYFQGSFKSKLVQEIWSNCHAYETSFQISTGPQSTLCTGPRTIEISPLLISNWHRTDSRAFKQRWNVPEREHRQWEHQQVICHIGRHVKARNHRTNICIQNDVSMQKTPCWNHRLCWLFKVTWRRFFLWVWWRLCSKVN